MQESSLRDDLLAIPGVEGAEVEGTDDRPAGLRIRIAEGADQGAVGTAIRRVLTSHGLGTDTRLPGEPAPPEGAIEDGTDVAPGDVVSAGELALDEPGPAPEVAAGPDVAPVAASVAVAEQLRPVDTISAGTADGPAPVIDLTDRTLDDVGDAAPAPADGSGPADGDEEDPGSGPEPASVEPHGDASPPVASSEAVGERRLASVAVEEGRAGVLVRVLTTTGDGVEQHAASSEGGVESAVVRATARLARPGAPEPTVVEIDDRRTEGADIVTIVLDVDGKLHAGSAVVVAGRAFALGRATWAALSL